MVAKSTDNSGMLFVFIIMVSLILFMKLSLTTRDSILKVPGYIHTGGVVLVEGFSSGQFRHEACP